MRDGVSAVRWRARLPDCPTAVAISGDAATVAVGLGSGHLVLVEASSGERRADVRAHEGAVLAVSTHPRDAAVATTGEDGAVRVHRAADSVTFDPPGGGWTEHLRWSQSGKRLAASQGKVLRVWSVDGRAVSRSMPVESTITGVAWSRDGHQVAVSCYGGVRLIDVTSGRVARRLDWPGSMLAVTWSPDGKFLACGCQDGTVHFWRVNNGKDSMMSGYPLKPNALSWSADSAWLATGGGAQITIWPFDRKGPEGRTPRVLEGHDQPVRALGFAPSGALLASGCRGGHVAVWDLKGDETPTAGFDLDGRVEVLAWSAAGPRAIFAAAESGELVGGHA